MTNPNTSDVRVIREPSVYVLGRQTVDPTELDRVRKAGAERVRERAMPRLNAALEVTGLR